MLTSSEYFSWIPTFYQNHPSNPVAVQIWTLDQGQHTEPPQVYIISSDSNSRRSPITINIWKVDSKVNVIRNAYNHKKIFVVCLILCFDFALWFLPKKQYHLVVFLIHYLSHYIDVIISRVGSYSSCQCLLCPLVGWISQQMN